jgi:hypothetical protein
VIIPQGNGCVGPLGGGDPRSRAPAYNLEGRMVVAMPHRRQVTVANLGRQLARGERAFGAYGKKGTKNNGDMGSSADVGGRGAGTGVICI